MKTPYLKIALVLIALIIASCSTLDSPDAPEFTFAFMTDIHIQPERAADKGFLQAIDNVNHLAPEFVITGGDLVMDASGQSFGRADSLFQLYNQLASGFEMPVYNTLGNHDQFGLYKESGISPDHPEYGKKMFENRIGPRYQSIKHKGWLFLLLDSVDDSEGNSYFGNIDSLQMDWIKNELKLTDPSAPIVLSTHIPFLTTKSQFDQGPLAGNPRAHIINNAHEVLELFVDYNLKLVLQGHLHFLEDMYVLNKIHFITGGAVCSRWWQGQNYGIEEGFLLIRAFKNDLSWEFIDYGWEVVE
ncbi:metallophosphoesterase [bacterium]|nr:metallophosphoesterase [bacterium]